MAALRQAIQSAEKNQSALAKLKDLAPAVEQTDSKTEADATRLHALAEILKSPAL